MRGRAIACAAIIGFLLAIGSEGAASGRQRPVLLFWNLENYFDPFDDTLTDDDEFTPDGYRHWTWDRFLRKRNTIAKVLISVHDVFGDFPVIAGFAEVENRMVLDQLVRNTALAKLGYEVIHRDSPDTRGIDVALIYRSGAFEPLEVAALPVDAGGRKTRDILKVKGVMRDVSRDADTLEVYVVHFPSKFGGEKQTRPFRIRAAETLSEAVCGGRAGRVIVMGDFNDTPDSEPVRLAGSMSGLVNLAEPLHEKGLGTIKYNGRPELIDMFLVSPMLGESDMLIYEMPMLMEKDSKFLGYKPYRTYYGPMWHGGASDHYPVVLLLNLFSYSTN